MMTTHNKGTHTTSIMLSLTDLQTTSGQPAYYCKNPDENEVCNNPSGNCGPNFVNILQNPDGSFKCTNPGHSWTTIDSCPEGYTIVDGNKCYLSSYLASNSNKIPNQTSSPHQEQHNSTNFLTLNELQDISNKYNMMVTQYCPNPHGNNPCDIPYGNCGPEFINISQDPDGSFKCTDPGYPSTSIASCPDGYHMVDGNKCYRN